jgi:carbonic anhydrase
MEPSFMLLRNVFRHVEDASELGDAAHTGELNFNELRNHVRNSQVFQYSGSLTTPPCAQNVAFNIVSSPINIDVSVYKRVKKILKFNSRYTQNHLGEKNLLDGARDILDTL